jgi:hypothetical protein
MAGLDPAIHGVRLPPALTRNRHGQVTRHRVDARVEPGHDKTKSNAENEILHAALTLMPVGLDPAIHGVPWPPA